MELPVMYKDQYEFTLKYISLFHFELKLTEKELEILSKLIIKFLELQQNDKGSAIYKLFNRESIVELCKENSLNINQYYNIKASLLTKKALFDKEGVTYINQLLLPRQKVTFNFKQYETKETEKEKNKD